MIPSTNSILSADMTIQESPTVQHKMIPAKKDTDSDRIIGECDKVESLKQTIFKILNTERYEYPIYSWNFGVEFIDLIGEPVTYVCPEIERRIQEALQSDDRIEAVDSFTFDTSNKGIVAVAFTVHSIYGDIEEEKVVSI